MASVLYDPSLDLTVLDTTTPDASIITIDTPPTEIPTSEVLEIARPVSKSRFEPDPELCLTPERTPVKTVHIEKHRDRHVHFDVPSSSSDSSLKNSENKENCHNPDLSKKDASKKVKKDRVMKPKNEIDNSDRKKYSYDVEIVEKHDVKFGPKIENHRPKAIVKEVIELPRNREIRPPLTTPVDMQGVTIHEEHIFTKPEMHSTLKLGKELQKLPVEKVNLKPKLEAKLQSTCVQLEKIKKTDAALNFESEQLFTRGLTDLDISENGMIRAMEREIKSKAPKTATLESTRLQGKSYPEPDLMECWMNSLELETYSSTLPGLPQPHAALQYAHSSSVYHHLRAWNI